jgi:predicted dehydrogenase
MNILIIGLGSIGLKHVASIRQVLTTPHDLFALRSDKNCNKIEGIRNIFHVEEMKIIPDFIIISNPTSLHMQSIEECAKFKVPLFIEKPVFHTLAGADKIDASVRGIPTYVACNLRFHPAIVFLKEHLSLNAQTINEVNIYCGSYLPEWRKEKELKKSYSVSEKMGGGVHLDLIHEVDYCCWLFGFPDQSDSLKRSASSLNIETPDYANYRMVYKGFTVSIILNYYRKDPKRSIEIVFDDDTWTIDLLACSIKNSMGEILFSYEFNMMQTYIEQMRYFINAIKNKESLMNNIKEAVRTLKVSLS